jgi:hypothetical protein
MNQYDQNRINENPKIIAFYNDIPRNLSESAYYNLSHYPERAASFIRAEYSQTLIEDKETVLNKIKKAERRNATVEPYWSNMFEIWFSSHRERIKNAFIVYLNSLSSTASWFITGSANFNVRRNEKKQKSADLRYEEIKDIRKKSINHFIRSVLPDGDGSFISSSDKNAKLKIEKKLKDLEESFSKMKLINTITRKNLKRVFDSKKCADEIKDKTDLEMPTILKLLEPNFNGEIKPFQQYQFNNIRSEIRRLKTRIESLEDLEDKKNFVREKFDNGVEIDISDDGKITVFFPEKPTIGVIDSLKQKSFKWSSYRKLWVRKYTKNALYDLNLIKSTLKKM